MSKFASCLIAVTFSLICVVGSGTASAGPLAGNLKRLKEIAASQQNLSEVHYRGYGIAAGLAAGFVGAAIASHYYYHQPYYYSYYGYPEEYPYTYYPYRAYPTYYPYRYYRAYPRYRYYRVGARHYRYHRHW